MSRIAFSIFTALVLAAGLVVSAGSASAQTRPYSPRMTCAAAAAMVQTRGAAVMSTGPNTFDRYVRARQFCTPVETTRPAWVKTADNPQCFVGYTCEDVENDRFPF